MPKKVKISLNHHGSDVVFADPTKHWEKLSSDHFKTSLFQASKFIDYHVYGTCYYAFVYNYSIVDDSTILVLSLDAYTNEKSGSINKHGITLKPIVRTVNTFFQSICRNAVLVVHDKNVEASKKKIDPINLKVFSIYSFCDGNNVINTVDQLWGLNQVKVRFI